MIKITFAIFALTFGYSLSANADIGSAEREALQIMPGTVIHSDIDYSKSGEKSYEFIIVDDFGVTHLVEIDDSNSMKDLSRLSETVKPSTMSQSDMQREQDIEEACGQANETSVSSQTEVS